MNQKQMEKEWNQMQKTEAEFVNQNLPQRTSDWQEKISGFIPKKLDETLNNAFCKAFELVLEKGTGLIEKTYNREKMEQDYKINEYAAEIKNNPRTMKVFGKKAGFTKGINQAISAAEGVGMGVIGMGIPDIPIFLGVLLKSIYEIALTYGYHYDTEEEQIFILKMIETALSHEEKLITENMELNQWIREQNRFKIIKSDQIKKTSKTLSEELLYLKFVQGIPIVGVIGGLSDMIYQKKISDYAAMKYKRRFIEDKRKIV